MKRSAEVVQRVVRQGISVACAALLISFPFGVPVSAQEAYPQYPAPAPEEQPAPATMLTPQQLDTMVAPIALYPDALLSQMLVACTYPMEIVEAAQWLQANRGMQGQQLMDAARQQNWDPSVQALVAFPDVLTRLASNASWTSDLGNAFLTQQTDVMNAIQQMRAQAQASGRLASDAQQRVVTQQQDGQNAIEIVPANPDVMYVPQYNPAYIWGPPAWGYYPSLYYPAVGFGFGFGSGIFIGSFFGGWGGWGGWGWGPNWFGRSIITRPVFFTHYGFHGFFGGGFGRSAVWAHNPYHRLGVPYTSVGAANRFGGSYFGRGGVVHAGVGGVRGSFAAGAHVRGAQAFAPGSTVRGGFGAGRSGVNSQFQGGARSFAPQGGGAAGGGNWRHFGQPNGSNMQRGGNAFGGNRVQQSAPQSQSPRSFAPQGGRQFNGGGFNGNRMQAAPQQQPRMQAPQSQSPRSFSPQQGRQFGGGGFNNPGRSSAPSFNGGGRSFNGGGGGGSHGGGGGAAPRSFNGGGGGGSHGGGGGAAPRSFGGGGGGGGGFHGGGGGGGSHGGGGGGSHGGGGGHGRR